MHQGSGTGKALDENKGDEGEHGNFQACCRPLEMVTYFKELGRILTNLDDDWSSVVGNIRKAWNIWARMSRIMGSEGAIPKVSGMFSKAVVQVVLIFDLSNKYR